jgi:hypothetical protein
MANIYKNTKTDLTSASATTVYTVPSDSRSIVKSILVNDDSGSGDTITLTLTNAAGTVFSLFKVKAVAANATVELLTNPLIMMESEILKATPATGNRLHIVVSMLEMNRS